MKYKKIWKYQPYRTSRREQDYQQVQEFLKSGDPELWKALYESAYEIVYQCAYGMDFCRVLGPDDYCEIADEAFALCYEQLDRYQGLSQFSGWVGGYSKNITRTRCRQVLTGLRYRRQLYEVSTGRMRDWDPLWILIRLERYYCLWKAISDISETSQRILEARILEKLSLRAIAQAVQGSIRSSDTLIRYGGDEFLLLFHRISSEVFFTRLRQIEEKVRTTPVEGYPQIRLSASIGGVYHVYPLAEAVRQADKLMYRSKSQKK